MPLLLQPPPSPCLLPSASPAHCCCCGGVSWEQPSRSSMNPWGSRTGKSRAQLPAPLPAHHRLLERSSKGCLTTSALDLNTLDRLEVETRQVWHPPPIPFLTDWMLLHQCFLICINPLMDNAQYCFAQTSKITSSFKSSKGENQSIFIFLSISGFPPYSEITMCFLVSRRCNR